MEYENVMIWENTSRDWWNENGKVRMLHRLNKIRVPYIKDLILSTISVNNKRTDLKDLKLLDVGCGAGILSEALAKQKANVTGIDQGDALMQVARAHAATNNEIKDLINYRLDTIEDHAQTNQGQYDAVVASEVIEHVENPASFLKACVQATKPGGSIFVTTINKTLKARLIALIFYEDIVRIIPKGAHQYEKFISPQDVSQILAGNGCCIKDITGLTYSYIRGSWRVVSNSNVFYALHAIKK